MSDPVTTYEIEDVLSSIRRLVSEGEKPRAEARVAVAPGVVGDGDSPARPDDAATDAPLRGARFVLTPALRVDPPVATRTAANDTPPKAGAAPAPTSATDGPLILGPAAVVSPDNSRSAETAQAEDAFPPENIAEAAPAEPGAASKRSAARASLEETIAELEAAITHQTDEWEPDGSEDMPVVDWASAASQAGLFAARGRRPAVVENAEELPPRATDVDGAPMDEPPQTAATAPFPMDADPDPSVGSAAAGIFGDDTVIDEAALRDLVADIVRQELQGKLGERITRNVRKLVRREIYRVISSEGFD